MDANRANAQHSTGPVSPDGKARVALNPVTHGLARVKMFLSGEEPAEFLELRQTIARRYHCTDVVGDMFADDAALAWWKIRRIAEWQAMLIDSAFADQPVPAPLARLFGDRHEKAMQTLQRYETSARSALHRAVHQLRALRAQEQSSERSEQADKTARVKEIRAAMERMMNSRTPFPELDELEADLENGANPISAPKTDPDSE
jgi:hypothetical protein